MVLRILEEFHIQLPELFMSKNNQGVGKLGLKKFPQPATY